VVWLGEREDIPEILRALDIVLVPSWEEPFGMVVIESMAMELPVIATEIGGPTEIVTPPKDGLLLPPRQPEAWASAIERLVERPHERLSMGRAARRRVAEALSVQIFVERVLDGYGEVLHR
jgi:glycosyltransferase involved in cell wall biosynthesis